MRRVPRGNDCVAGVVRVVTEDAERRRVEREVHPLVDGKADPAGGQGAEEVAVGEEGHVAGHRAQPADEAVGTARIWPGDSPSGAPSRKRFQSGREAAISSRVIPS